MPNNPELLCTTEVPRFIDAGGYMRCELVSGGRTYCFRIEWVQALEAMGKCEQVVDQHFLDLHTRGSGVVRLGGLDGAPEHC